VAESHHEVWVLEAGDRGSAELTGALTAAASEDAGSYTILVDDAHRPWALITSGEEQVVEWERHDEHHVEAGEPGAVVEIVVHQFEQGVVLEVEGELGVVPRHTDLYDAVVERPGAIANLLASGDILVPGLPGTALQPKQCQDCGTVNWVIAYVPGMLCANKAYEHEFRP
jgi:hypothetical protein